MTASMNALCAYGWNLPPRMEQVAMPSAASGETLVRIEAAGLTHLDLTVLSGQFNIRPDLPYIGGVEGAGTVINSARFPAGSRVSIRGGGLGLTRSGTWAEFVVVRDELVFPVPDALETNLAAVSFDPLVTAYVTLHDIARLGGWSSAAWNEPAIPMKREVVAVIGAAGAVGSVVVQLALRAGARAIGVVSSAESAAHVPAGAETVVATDGMAVAELSRQRQITLLIDTIGGPQFAERLGWVKAGCRAAILGYTAGGEVSINLPNWFLEDVSVLPVNMIRRHRRAEQVSEELIALLAAGDLTLNVESMPMQEIDLAINRLRGGKVKGRLVITL